MLPDFAQSWSLVVTVVNCLNLKNIPALFSSLRPFGRSEHRRPTSAQALVVRDSGVATDWKEDGCEAAWLINHR